MKGAWAFLVIASAGCATELVPAPELAAQPASSNASSCPVGTKPMQGQCVRVRVAPKLSCGGGGRQVGKQCQYDVPQLAMTPEAPEAPAQGEPGEQVHEVLELLPDDRPLRTQPAARASLVKLAQSMEALIAQTAAASPERAGYLMQLSEHYVELAARAELEVREAVKRADRGAEQGSKLVALASRRQAVKLYRQLLREHPSYERADEVRYWLAIELGLQGDKAAMRGVLKELADLHPESELAARAREALEP